MFGYTDEETVVQLHGTGPWDIEYILINGYLSIFTCIDFPKIIK
jgi:hypothetical protein